MKGKALALSLGLLVGAAYAESPYTGEYRYDNYRNRIWSQLRLTEAKKRLCKEHNVDCKNILRKQKSELTEIAYEFLQGNNANTDNWVYVNVHHEGEDLIFRGKTYAGKLARVYTITYGAEATHLRQVYTEFRPDGPVTVHLRALELQIE